jgi:hypothetical protein
MPGARLMRSRAGSPVPARMPPPQIAAVLCSSHRRDIGTPPAMGVLMSEATFPMASASLPVRFVIYLPAGRGWGAADASEIEAAVADLLCERFGGVTAYPAKGTFTMASGVIHTEPVTVLEAYCEREAWQQSQAGIAVMAGMLARLLEQEALGCSVDGKMILMDAARGDAGATGTGANAAGLRTLLRSAFG